MRRRCPPILTLALLAHLGMGCSPDPTATEPTAAGSTGTGPLIRTDQSIYTASRGADTLDDGSIWGEYVELAIPLTYTNTTGGPITLPTCLGVNPPALEKREGTGWRVAYCPIVPACLGPPVVILPGEVYRYDYRVRGYLPGGRILPQFETSVPGTYRLIWDAYETWTPNSGESGLGRVLPLEKRVSNEFEIVE
jgi:hypothetical protein